MKAEFNSDWILENSPFAVTVIEKNHHKIKYLNAMMRGFLAIDQKVDINEEAFIKYIPEKSQSSFFEMIDQINHPSVDLFWQMMEFHDSQGLRKRMLIKGTNGGIDSGTIENIILVGIPLSGNDKLEIYPAQTNKQSKTKYQDDKYKSIIDSATIGISILDKNGFIEEANPTFIKNICMGEDDVLEKHFCAVFSGNVKSKISSLLKEIKRTELTHVKGIIKIDKGDHDHTILEVSLSEIYNDFEKQFKYMIITEDITNLQDSQAALLQSEKLALTGKLAASLAHEINNPLQTSLGCLGLAEEMLSEDNEDLRTYIHLASEELQRSARIVKKLRDLNRSADPSEKEEVDIQEIIKGVLLLTKNRLQDRNIVPVFNFDDPPSLILGSKDQIQQVLLNLAINAIDAMPKGGNIYFEITPTTDPIGKKISIRDTGQGIDPMIQKKIFNPFVTTKEDGLGLGLYLSRKIINDHDGWMQVESKVDQGTQITLWLPSLQGLSGTE